MAVKDLSSPGRRQSDQEANAIECVGHVENMVRPEVHKYPFERQWMLNLAYFMGHMDVRWDQHRNMPLARRIPKHRSRYTANKILTAVERAVGMWSELRPTWDAAPGTGSVEDRSASRMANSYLDFAWDECEMESKIGEMLEWSCITGTGILWNTIKSNPRTRERLYFDPVTGSPVSASLLTDPQKRKLEQRGDYLDYFASLPDVEVVAPFRIHVDPNADSLGSSQVLMRVGTYSLDEVYDRFGSIVPTEELPAGMTEYEARIRSFYGPYSGGYMDSNAGAGDADRERTVVKEVFLKPYVKRRSSGKGWDEYPNGRHIIVAGGVVLQDGENWAYRMGFRDGFPCQIFPWHKVPGRIWGMGMVEHMIDPMRAYNEVRRQVIDNYRIVGQPKWTAPYGSDLKRSSITDRPGEIIFYNAAAGPPPQVQTPMTVDGTAVSALMQGSLGDLQDASSQHDILQSKIPSEMRSGPALELAMEGDKLTMKPRVRRLERCVGGIGENLIRTAAEIVDENTLVEVVGSGRMREHVAFSAAMFKGVKSVKVLRGSFMPTSKGMELQKVMDMASAGVINPSASTADRELVLRAIEYGEGDPDLMYLHQDRRTAEEENELMSMPPGEGFVYPTLESWHDDIVHLNAHTELARSHEFKLMGREQQDAIRNHIQEHQKRLQQAEEAAMQRTLIAKGAPGPKGTPSPPKRSR